jgi:Cupredoxin-like domain
LLALASYVIDGSDNHSHVEPMHPLTLAVLLLAITTVTALAADPQIALSIRDHQFVPSDVPMPADVKVELVIKNEQTTTAEFESTSLHREKIIPAGGQISVFVGPLSAGTYEFFDDFNRATRGRLIVK